MIRCKVKAILVKVAALGLEPHKHLGLTLEQIQPHMINMVGDSPASHQLSMHPNLMYNKARDIRIKLMNFVVACLFLINMCVCVVVFRMVSMG